MKESMSRGSALKGKVRVRYYVGLVFYTLWSSN